MLGLPTQTQSPKTLGAIEIIKMDSKNIYISYQHYSNDIKWERHGESEWMYIGAEEDFKEEKAVKLINTFFTESELYFITDRHNSFLIEKDDVIAKVKEYLTDYRTALANKDFSKIVEFDKIGILRKGQRKNLT